jgi:two-component sensor histidine kinase
VDASRDASTVDFADVLKRVVGKSLLDDPPLTGTAVRVAADPVPVNLEVATHLALITSELVSNAFQHAFPETPGTVEIALSGSATGRARLAVHDDGVGLPPAVEPHRGDAPSGLWLVATLVEQVSGEWSVSRSGGTRVDVLFAAG